VGSRCGTASASKLRGNGGFADIPGGNVLSQTVVGWLLLLGAIAIFVAGFLLRTLIGRKRDVKAVRRVVRAFRDNVVGRVLFGRVASDALDDEELDQMILMPAILLSCGLCLTAIFLLGYEALT